MAHKFALRADRPPRRKDGALHQQHVALALPRDPAVVAIALVLLCDLFQHQLGSLVGVPLVVVVVVVASEEENIVHAAAFFVVRCVKGDRRYDQAIGGN